MSYKLDEPTRKLFICDLKCSRREEKPGDSEKKCRRWKLTVQNYCKEIIYSAVWIQGVVVEDNEAGTELYVDDGTGVARIIGCDKIPPLCPKVKKGQYVLVIGPLLQQAPAPVIRAMKIQNLSSSGVNESSWILEVIDQTLS